MSTSAWAVWETLRSLRSVFGSSGSSAKESSATVSLEQQVTSTLLPSRDDEAVQAAIDAALHEIDPMHLTRVQKVRGVLVTHQLTDWRKNLGSIKLTEKFEQVMISEIVTKTSAGDATDKDPAAIPLRKRGGQQREETKRTFDRRQRDYEWTAEDPRIRHLILVSQLVASEKTGKKGIEKAKQYLLTAGLITEKSAAEIATEKLSKGKEAAFDAVYTTVASTQLGDDFARIDKLPDGPKKDKRLSNALDLKHQAKKDELAALKAASLPKWFWIAAGVGIAISGILLATSLPVWVWIMAAAGVVIALAVRKYANI